MQADSRSTPSVPTFASVQNGFPPAASTSPLVNHSGSATEQIPRSSAPFQEPTTMALIDPLVANSDNTSFSGASNTTFPFQTSQPGGFHPDPSHGSTVFPWSGAWGSNSNWNKFSQDLSFVATDLTPPGLSQEVYDGVTGLAALQAQNTFLQTGNSGNSGPVPTSGLGMVAPNVQTHGQHASASPSPSPYTTGIHQSPQWPTGQNYSFSDNGLRNVPNEQ